MLYSCKKYFDTQDIYTALKLTKDATGKEIKISFRQLSLQIHPDRVAECEKEEATEKFKVLSKIYSILTNPIKKKLYDVHGIIDDNEIDCNWHEIFEQTIATENRNVPHQSYIGSAAEMNDIRKAYLDGHGCFNFILKSVPFMSVEDRPRIDRLINGWIANHEVPELMKLKKGRRKKKTPISKPTINKVKNGRVTKIK